MLTFSEIQEIVSNITYKKGWKFFLILDEDRPYIQVGTCTEDSTKSGVFSEWKSGKNYLSYHMCRQEIVGTVFQAIERAELHEMKEFFRYKNAAIYNPHLDPEVLALIAKKYSSFNMRENAMSMIE